MVCKIQGAFAFNPKLAVLVNVISAAALVAKVGEPFIFKRHPMFFAIIKGNEPSPAERSRNIDHDSYTDKTTPVTVMSVIRAEDGPNRFANLFCYFSVSKS